VRAPIAAGTLIQLLGPRLGTITTVDHVVASPLLDEPTVTDPSRSVLLVRVTVLVGTGAIFGCLVAQAAINRLGRALVATAPTVGMVRQYSTDS
jgi:hypothetical protein